MLFFFDFIGDTSKFGVEVEGEVIEEYFDGFAFVVAKFALVVDFEASSVEGENFFDFVTEIVLE